MMNSKMKKLALAVGVALGGMGVLSSSQAMNLATDGLGQVLIFPYYTVQGGWTTLFNITNTSNRFVAAKVRFHESYNSRDVFDFNVVMSPNDVWNGWVAKKGDVPAFYTQDKSCTTFVNVPLNPATDGIPFYLPEQNIDGTLAYTGTAADGGPTTLGRMNEGYVEVIMMAATADGYVSDPINNPNSQLIFGAKHVNSTPPGCVALANAFLNYNGGGLESFDTLTSEFDSYDVNPLKGSYNLVNGVKGWTASGSPTTIANFATAPILTTTLGPQDVPFEVSFVEPSLNSGNTAPAGTGVDDAALSTSAATGGVNAVSGLLARTNVINQWSRITASTNNWVTATDWVLTFPTKGFYVDNWPATPYSARATGRTVVAAPTVPVVVPTVYPSPFAKTFDDSTLTAPANKAGVSCFGTPFNIFDREENEKKGAGISPGGSKELCYETNVLTFGTPGLVATNILASATAKGVNQLPGDSGYLNVGLTNTAPTGTGAVANISQGLPVIGFMITSRDTGNGELNEAFLVDHAYLRTAPIIP